MLAELRITPVDARKDFAATLAGVLRVVHDGALQVVEGDRGAQIVRGCHEEARKHTDRVLIDLASTTARRAPTSWPQPGSPARGRARRAV